MDCFWLNAGYAVFGGYKGGGAARDGLTLEDALDAVRTAIWRLTGANRMRDGQDVVGSSPPSPKLRTGLTFPHRRGKGLCEIEVR